MTVVVRCPICHKKSDASASDIGANLECACCGEEFFANNDCIVGRAAPHRITRVSYYQRATLVVWCINALLVFVALYFWLILESRAISAAQEAAGAALFVGAVLAAYVLARSTEKILDTIERLDKERTDR